MRITPPVCSFAYSCHQHVPTLSGRGGSSIVPPLHGATSRVCHHLIGTAPATPLSPTVKVRVDWNHRAANRFGINHYPRAGFLSRTAYGIRGRDESTAGQGDGKAAIAKAHMRGLILPLTPASRDHRVGA